MGQNSNIEWCDHTFNPWIGCSKVSPGCKNCYAETLMDKRHGRVEWGPHGTRVRTSDANWKQPLKWNRQAEKEGVRRKVFCASLADVFEDRQDLVEWRTDLFKLIDATPHLDWLLLTKRPENIARMWREIGDRGWLDDKRQNVWLGVSAEDQQRFDERVQHLARVRHLCKHTFVSMEPMLGPINVRTHLGLATDRDGLTRGFGAIDWIIVGGESGPGKRPFDPEWARVVRDLCAEGGVAFFGKQFDKVRELPEDLQVHQFPTAQ